MMVMMMMVFSLSRPQHWIVVLVRSIINIGRKPIVGRWFLVNNDDDDDDTGDDDGDFGDDIVGLFYDNEILYFTLWCK